MWSTGTKRILRASSAGIMTLALVAGFAVFCVSSTTHLPRFGLIAATVATFVERYEFGPIDDNILITVCATAVLLLGVQIGPLL